MQTEPVRNPFEDKSSVILESSQATAILRMSRLPRLLKVDFTTLFSSFCLRTSPLNPNACNR